MSGGTSQGVQLAFKLYRMQARFLDRKIANALSPVKRRFFMRSGAAIRLAGRRRLRKAPQVPVSQMSRQERVNYDTALRLYRDGVKQKKPRRPDRTAPKGQSPYLHATWDSGTSPLKHRLWFALTESLDSVVIGPAAIGRNLRAVKRGGISTLQELERNNPFMEPAYKAIEPRLPDFLRIAAGL